MDIECDFECEVGYEIDTYSSTTRKVYRFPKIMANASITALSSKEIYQRLRELVDHPDYLEIRDEYCALHIELNSRMSKEQIQAPRFRVQCKRPFPKGGASAER